MSYCHRCRVQLMEGALFCISCGARQAERVKVDLKFGSPAITSRGYLMVQPSGLYNATPRSDKTALPFSGQDTAYEHLARIYRRF